jgi:hypothetical protein
MRRRVRRATPATGPRRGRRRLPGTRSPPRGSGAHPETQGSRRKRPSEPPNPGHHYSARCHLSRGPAAAWMSGLEEVPAIATLPPAGSSVAGRGPGWLRSRAAPADCHCELFLQVAARLVLVRRARDSNPGDGVSTAPTVFKTPTARRSAPAFAQVTAPSPSQTRYPLTFRAPCVPHPPVGAGRRRHPPRHPGRRSFGRSGASSRWRGRDRGERRRP